MAGEKRDPKFDPQLQLQEVETAPVASLRAALDLPVDFMMEQVVDELRSLPDNAQRAILRLMAEELVDELDEGGRAELAADLGLSGQTLH